MTISDYAELKLLDAVANGSTTGGGLPTADPWVKLHISDPGEAPTSGTGGSAAGETTRKQVSFAPASAGAVVSSTDAAWTNVSTSETYSHISLWDNGTSGSGNALWSGALTATKQVTAGDNFTIPSGSLSLALD